MTYGQAIAIVAIIAAIIAHIRASRASKLALLAMQLASSERLLAESARQLAFRASRKSRAVSKDKASSTLSEQ